MSWHCHLHFRFIVIVLIFLIYFLLTLFLPQYLPSWCRPVTIWHFWFFRPAHKPLCYDTICTDGYNRSSSWRFWRSHRHQACHLFFVLFTRLTDWLPFRKWGHPVNSGLRVSDGTRTRKRLFEVVPEPQSGRLPITGYWYHINKKTRIFWIRVLEFLYQIIRLHNYLIFLAVRS